MTRVREVGEFGLIGRVAGRVGRASLPTTLGIGDDAALLAPPAGFEVATTTDMLLEGVHFLRGKTPPADLGWKSLAASLSDLAAMGAVPVQAFLSLGLPADAVVEEVDSFLDGFLEAAAAGGAVLAGGDTVSSRSGWAVSVTAIGLVEEGRALRRDRARPGDTLFLSGPVGDSAAGLDLLLGKLDLPVATAAALVRAHQRPPFEIALGRALVAAGGRCAIDVSDGVLADLGHVLERSGVGARVDADRIPLSPALREAGEAAGTDPLRWALAGGEDYRLLFTLEPGREGGMDPLFPIGEITEEAGLVLLRGGREVPAPKRGGYDHFPSD